MGGFRLDGELSWSWNKLQEILSQNFDKDGEPLELPWVIRKNARNYHI